jgi:hypothetical protein
MVNTDTAQTYICISTKRDIPIGEHYTYISITHVEKYVEVYRDTYTPSILYLHHTYRKVCRDIYTHTHLRSTVSDIPIKTHAEIELPTLYLHHTNRSACRDGRFTVPILTTLIGKHTEIAVRGPPHVPINRNKSNKSKQIMK